MRRDFWALLSICVVALCVRAAVLVLFPSIHHPDEVFQYLEQAHRLRTGDGLVPWEFLYGARSWLLPGLLAGVMAIGGWFAPAPEASLAAVAVVLCLISLVGVVCGYWWGRRAAGFMGGVTAGLLNATWFELVALSTHVLSETFAAAALVGGLFLIYPYRVTPSLRRSFLGAVLLGVAVVVRVQLLPAVLVGIVAVSGGRVRDGYAILLPGLLLALLFGGLLDWLTLGQPFQSVTRYVWYNTAGGVAVHAGLSPLTEYVTLAATLLGPFVVLVAFSATWGGSRLPPLLLVSLTVYAVHSLIGHKEYRFVSPAMPLVMTLAGIGSVFAMHSAANCCAARSCGMPHWQPCRCSGSGSRPASQHELPPSGYGPASAARSSPCV